MPSDTPGTYTGAYAWCRDPSGRLLLVRMARGLDRVRWTLPGGGIEWGEHPDAAVVRELEEETGITDVRRVQVAAIYSHTYQRTVQRPYPPVHYIGIVYEVTWGDSISDSSGVARIGASGSPRPRLAPCRSCRWRSSQSI